MNFEGFEILNRGRSTGRSKVYRNEDLTISSRLRMHEEYNINKNSSFYHVAKTFARQNCKFVKGNLLAQLRLAGKNTQFNTHRARD